MNMSIKPRYLLLVAAVAVGLYFAGVSLSTLLWLAAGAYMVSMHLGGHGHGGHGGHGEGPTGQARTGDVPSAEFEQHKHR